MTQWPNRDNEIYLDCLGLSDIGAVGEAQNGEAIKNRASKRAIIDNLRMQPI
jgi:hypothetical protein